MAAVLTASLWLILLSVGCFMVVSADQKNITAKPGENATLPCSAAENKPVLVAEWSRTDLGSDQFIILYRDKKFDPDGQSEAFRNRVELKNVKNGDVSLILKNVTTNDTGTYECRVVQSVNDRRKRSHLNSDPISIVHLIVSGNNDGSQKEGRSGLIAGVVVGVIFVVVVGVVFAVFLICRKKQRNMEPVFNN